jgi:hypothetical protein
MNKGAKPRFNSAEAALRFFFRAHNLLGGSGESVFQVPRNLPEWLVHGEGVFGDFTAVASSLYQLDEFEIWLMSELYGPTGFDARQRTLGRAWRAAQTRFPDRRMTLRDIARFRRSTVEILRRRLAIKGLIPAAGGAPAGPVIGGGNHAGARTGTVPMGH